MLSNRLAVAIVGGACVLAAGAGAYVATRQSSPAGAAPGASPVEMSSPAAVEETEAVMQPEPRTQLRPADQPQGVPPAAAPAPEPAPQAPRQQIRRPRPARAPIAKQTPRADPVPQPPVARQAEEPPIARSEPAAPPRDYSEPVTPVVPQRILEELTIPADSVVGLQIEETVSTETARVEDRVEARVTRDVLAGGRVVVPEGTRALGTVTLVEQGGKVKERSRLGVRFHTLVLDNGTTLAMQSDTIYREGESPGKASAAKIGGGAIGGAIIGGILGGTRGAVIGGSVGAAGGTAATMAGSRRAATLPAGSTVTVRVLSPVTVTVER